MYEYTITTTYSRWHWYKGFIEKLSVSEHGRGPNYNKIPKPQLQGTETQSSVTIRGKCLEYSYIQIILSMIRVESNN